MNSHSEASRDRTVVADTKMHFLLKGFTQVREFRVFAFEGVTAEWTRTAFTVRANPVLARLHGIRLQELPLLCRAVLEELDESEAERAFTLTEEHMRHAKNEASRNQSVNARRGRSAPVE